MFEKCSTYLYHVGGEGVGAADEAKHSRLISDDTPELLQSLPHERARLFRVDGAHRFHLQEQGGERKGGAKPAWLFYSHTDINIKIERLVPLHIGRKRKLKNTFLDEMNGSHIQPKTAFSVTERQLAARSTLTPLHVWIPHTPHTQIR